MSVEIKHRWSDRVLATGETVREAVLEAYASDAVLRGAVLRGADLRGAVFRDADLRGADLRGAVFRGADLRGADLRGAVLRDAVLRGADLSGADLSGAVLRDADGFNLVIPTVENIHQTVYESARHEGALAMETWHQCETTHCRGGWAIHHAGLAGRVLESCLGSNAAAALIYIASDPTMERVPNFYASNEQAMEDMRVKAEDEAARVKSTTAT
jgi:uncharacterized protein YjbI with pentapeptide repeats